MIAGLGQVALTEGIAVSDEHPARFESLHIDLERRRVHRHQHIGTVTRRMDLVAGDVNLKRGHAGERTGRGAYLGREIR